MLFSFKPRSLALGAVAAMSLSSIALAAPTTIQFTGEVLSQSFTDEAGVLNGLIAPGTTITRSWTFDSATPDEDADPTSGEYTYAGPPYQLKAVFGATPVESGSVKMQMLDNAVLGIGTLDRYGVMGRDLGMFNVGGVDVEISQFHIFLTEETLTAHSNDGLFSTAPDLSKYGGPFDGFAQGQLIGRVGRADSLVFMNFSVTSVSALPEPSSFVLGGLGILGVGVGMRRRARKLAATK